MKMTIRRSLCALATIVLAAGLGACSGDELSDALDRALDDAGLDDSGRGGSGADAGGSDAGNPALDVGIGGDDTGGGGGDGGEDGLGCFDIVQCINNGDGSEASVNACISQGTTTGQSLVNALVGCIQNNCGTAQTEDELAACQQQFCATEISACQADTNGGGGGGGEEPVGNTGAYESCNAEPCQAGMACGSFDGTNGYCFPECGVGGACVGWDGAPGICAVGLEGGGGTTPTHCLPTCTDTEASSDCPSGWTCEVQQGQGVCSP